MIANERQYQVTRKKLGDLTSLRDSARNDTEDPDGFRDLQIAAVESKMEDLQEELDEYERLRSGAVTTIESRSLAGLADALIKARIARGWTQGDLAKRLDVAEQQVQRDETNRYAGAALSRLCDVAEALGVDVSETVTLRAS
jgi:HTH-type transcriptional regulator/antitoxin HigA